MAYSVSMKMNYTATCVLMDVSQKIYFKKQVTERYIQYGSIYIKIKIGISKYILTFCINDKTVQEKE